MKFTPLLFVFFFYAEVVFGQAGDLDSSFNKTGIVRLPLFYETTGVGIQRDGKIVVIGDPFSTLIRCESDGSLDSSFGSKVILYPINGGTMLIQPDDKIELVSANIFSDSAAGFIFTRYNVNGTLDSTFGKDGFIFIPGPRLLGYPAALQSGDKIYLTGPSYPYTQVNKLVLAKFNVNGTPDSSFGHSGLVEEVVDSNSYRHFSDFISIQENGKIIVGTTEPSTNALLTFRFSTNGSNDSSYGTNGRNIQAFDGYFATCSGIAIQNDSLLISQVDLGTDSSIFTILARLRSDGRSDGSFGMSGQIHLDIFPESGAQTLVQPDNKILILGSKHGVTNIDAELERFTPDGGIDSSFGINGKIATDFGENDFPNRAILDEDGRILMSATTAEYLSNGTFLARYLSGLATGTLDFSKQNNSAFIYPNPIHSNETLKYSLSQNENISINLYDVGGRIVQSFLNNQKRIAGEHQEELKFSPALTPGEYILGISNGNNTASIKIVKQ